ncbi:MAG: hypothetical protein KAS71_02010 [Bacteroidales bacterium]|nr:hypothetical protein [Bacteroidales bacterium]
MPDKRYTHLKEFTSMLTEVVFLSNDMESVSERVEALLKGEESLLFFNATFRPLEFTNL